MTRRRSPPTSMPTMPMSHPLITSPIPTLKEKGVPFLLAVERLAPGQTVKRDTESLAVKNLATVQLADVTHADFVSGLGSSTGAQFSIINGDTTNDLLS